MNGFEKIRDVCLSEFEEVKKKVEEKESRDNR